MLPASLSLIKRMKASSSVGSERSTSTPVRLRNSLSVCSIAAPLALREDGACRVELCARRAYLRLAAGELRGCALRAQLVHSRRLALVTGACLIERLLRDEAGGDQLLLALELDERQIARRDRLLDLTIDDSDLLGALAGQEVRELRFARAHALFRLAS